MKTSLFIIVLVFLSQFVAQAQSGWVREKGKLFAQGSISYFSSDKYYNTSGILQTSTAGTNFNTATFKLYGEYGLTDNITLLANIPLIQSNSLSTTNSIVGVGNIRLGAKYQLVKTLPISLAVEAEIPTNNGEQFAEASADNALGFRDRINLPTSDGELNVWTTLAASKSSSSGKFYGTAYGSLNIRTEGLSHQTKFGVEAGTFLFDKLWLIGKLSAQKSLSDELEIVPFLFGEGTEFTSYGLTAMYSLSEKISITAEYSDYAGFIINQQNIYDGPTFSVGIAFEL